jgi:hypothetical protein
MHSPPAQPVQQQQQGQKVGRQILLSRRRVLARADTAVAAATGVWVVSSDACAPQLQMVQLHPQLLQQQQVQTQQQQRAHQR